MIDQTKRESVEINGETVGGRQSTAILQNQCFLRVDTTQTDTRAAVATVGIVFGCV